MGPATYGVGGALGSSLLSRLDPFGVLDAPRRAAWNGIDSLLGGQTSGREVFVPPSGRPDDAFASQSGEWKRGTEAKGLAGMLPAIAGLIAGGVGTAFGSPAAGIPAGLFAAGLAQKLGESSTDSDKLQAPESLLGLEPGSGASMVEHMALDPMNLLGITAAAKGPGLFSAAAKEVPGAAAGRLGGMVEREAMNASPLLGRAGNEGFGEAARTVGMPRATGTVADTSGIDKILADLRAVPELRAESAEPSELLKSLSRPSAGRQTMAMDFANPMAIPRQPTSNLRPSRKPPGVL